MTKLDEWIASPTHETFQEYVERCNEMDAFAMRAVEQMALEHEAEVSSRLTLEKTVEAIDPRDYMPRASYPSHDTTFGVSSGMPFFPLRYYQQALQMERRKQDEAIYPNKVWIVE